MLNEEFNLFEEFKKRVERLQNGNFLRIKQLSNFVKFYGNDRKEMVEYFRDVYVDQDGDIPKLMFECLTDIISTTFYKQSKQENSFYVLFSKMLFSEFGWMVKKFKTKHQIEQITNLIKSWSEFKWGPLKEPIYLEDFTNFLCEILFEHEINLDDQNYVKQLDNDIYLLNLNSRANNFIKNGLQNDLVREYFNIDARDKVLEEQFRLNVNKNEFIELMENNDPKLLNRKKNIVMKFRPIFDALKNKLMEQIVRREMFIKQLLTERDNLCSEYEQGIKK